MNALVTTVERDVTAHVHDTLTRVAYACGCDAARWDRVIVAGADRWTVPACPRCADAVVDALRPTGLRVTTRPVTAARPAVFDAARPTSSATPGIAIL